MGNNVVRSAGKPLECGTCAPRVLKNATNDLRGEPSVSGSSATFADSVGVNRRTATSGESPDSCALLSTGNTANKGAGTDAACSGELIAMFLPKTSSMFVAIPNTG